MEDLIGLNFTPSPSNQPNSPPTNQTRFSQGTNYISPTPSRGLSPNYSIALSQATGGTKQSVPRNALASKPDSFASLSMFSGISRPHSKNENASLEQQRLTKEREKREALEREKQSFDIRLDANEFWQKKSQQHMPSVATTDGAGVDLSVFSSDAPVNRATYFPPPKDDVFAADSAAQDPFDMSGFAESLSGRTRYVFDHTSPDQAEPSGSSDDILGVLAQPVETFQKPKSPSPKPGSTPPARLEDDSSGDEDVSPRDNAIAAIVEMGFSIGQATKALAQTPSGVDVQGALDNLLSRPSSSASSRLEQPPSSNRATPDPYARHRPDPSKPQQKDLSQIAGGMGTSFLKGAGNLWKTGRQKVNTLIQEYQTESPPDSSVPKWMRDQQRHVMSVPGMKERITDEARVLEAREETRRPQRHETTQLQMDARSAAIKDRLSLRKQVDEEAEMGYRSSARRRIPSRTSTPSHDPPSRTATPHTKPVEVDLFSSSTEGAPRTSSQRPSRVQTPQPHPTTSLATPKPQRPIPPTSDTALASSHTSRQRGSEAFKAGDYTLALSHYTMALDPLPVTHPQRIIVLSNRAITNIKLGDAKAAVSDCDDLLSLVGPARGEGETISDIEGSKSLRDIWGKGVLRRAAALEMQEKYADALEMWKLAVEAGIGGSQSLEGRRRCENALGIKPAPSKSIPMSRTSSTGTQRSSNNLRASTPIHNTKKPRTPRGPSATETLAQVNAAAAADEEERLRLYDTVDGKVSSWQNGKESNLRALLSSLDSILWPEAGWKKVNMAELVIANKVKITYMKAIAKVHPDKISTGATIEQKMIAAAVFARLNDAWGVFKEQNGL